MIFCTIMYRTCHFPNFYNSFFTSQTLNLSGMHFRFYDGNTPLLASKSLCVSSYYNNAVEQTPNSRAQGKCLFLTKSLWCRPQKLQVGSRAASCRSSRHPDGRGSSSQAFSPHDAYETPAQSCPAVPSATFHWSQEATYASPLPCAL